MQGRIGRNYRKKPLLKNFALAGAFCSCHICTDHFKLLSPSCSKTLSKQILLQNIWAFAALHVHLELLKQHGYLLFVLLQNLTDHKVYTKIHYAPVIKCSYNINIYQGVFHSKKVGNYVLFPKRTFPIVFLRLPATQQTSLKCTFQV